MPAYPKKYFINQIWLDFIVVSKDEIMKCETNIIKVSLFPIFVIIPRILDFFLLVSVCCFVANVISLSYYMNGQGIHNEMVWRTHKKSNFLYSGTDRRYYKVLIGLRFQKFVESEFWMTSCRFMFRSFSYTFLATQ